MKELVLTHVGKGQVDGVKNAVIALVDYDAYKVSVKKIPVTKGFLETGELSELIKAGKLRVYRDMLESSYDAWLAIDPARGCLAVDKDGNVVTMSTYEYLYRLGRWPSSYEPSGADAYSPYRYGQAGESFYAVVKEIERKHNASLKSEAVRKDILDQTGVFIKYTVYKESMPEEESGTYVVTLFGRTVDRLDVVCEGGSVCVNVQGGIIEEVWGDCDGCIRIVSGANGNVRRVKVSQRVKRLEFNMSVPEGDVYPEIITDAKTCELASIDGYHRADADLSMFQHLKEFSNCWQMSSYSREGDVYSLRLQLPGVSNTEFDECFYNVDIKELYPYMQADGVLDITGLAHVKKSFHNFRGPTFIRGIVAGVIDGSFITNDFNGQFDVTAGYVDNSFGYISEKVRRSGYGGVFSHAVGIKANYHPEGVIHINLHDDVLRDCISDVRDKRLIFGSTEIRLRDARYDCTLTYWKQVQNINYAGDSLDIPVVLDLNETVTFNVFANMQFCRIVSSFWSDKSVISPNLKGLVTQLDAGDYPYSNVLHYGDRCFASRRFKNMFLCVLPEGLQSIGERAFFQTKGVDYLVIPKSCQHIGAAAFVEMKSSTDDLTVICVYRDSYAHKWSKGKKYNIKVIDSLEDIPQQASKESEYDYLAAFVDTPDWAVNSKPVVAKILTMFPVDVVERIPVVATLTAELSHYFAEKQNDLVQASKEREAEDTGNSFTVAAGTDKPCKAGYISRAALQAAALNALYGACPELLTVDILDKFAWRFTQIHEVVKWVGTPKVTSDNSVAHEITVYLRGNEVLYVGCGFIRDRGIKQGLSVDASVSWEVPQKVLSSEILLGPDLEGQLVVYSVWG